MLGAFRRNGVAHALRASAPRFLSARVTPQQLQWHPPAFSAVSHVPRSLFHASRVSFSAVAEAQAQNAEADQDGRLSNFKQLADQGLVDPIIIRTLDKKMGIKTMTDVQSMTIQETLQGNDVLAQAKTGTGKTLAFLIPVVQNIIKDPTVKKRSYRRSGPGATSADIRAIIISPTRELAEQIATEAKKIASGTGIVVQSAVGGTRKMEGLRRIQREGCHLLVGTPGRLKDILSDPESGVEAPKLSSFVLDEADRLLDDGFAPEIFDIQRLLPDPMKVDRQTLMFSATVPREVLSMVHQTMKPDFKTIQTVKEDEVPTHLAVPQKTVTLDGFQNALPAILELAKNYQAHVANDRSARPFKAIVYFNSTMQVNLAYQVFSKLLNNPDDRRSGHPLNKMYMMELHSRLTQNRRTLTSDFFRNSRSGILFSSDVTARGLDFPDVTHVIQVGAPRSRDTYIHRIGRTGRANKEGEGWILLHPGENGWIQRRLGDLPIEKDHTLATAVTNMREEVGDDVSPSAAESVSQVKEAMLKVPEDIREQAFKSQLGTLMSVFSRPRDMILAMNELAVHGYYLPEPPSISPGMAQNLGVADVREANVSGRRFGSPRGQRDSSRGPSQFRGGRDNRRGSHERNYERNHERNHERSHERSYDSRRRGSNRWDNRDRY
ncbi:P-loop containing nucleoside triphosphate hydrolase protein [Aspergillus pseudonomiae]|uniref:ATP-dependent RNA helicase n=1 Tax=Aspergillus pseudonomiae TaxID=1506151 RepID=A0A5N6HMZ5_9EURO|nr:P-loop containing nucleoside triphosphate hydrolase protein [Aspergillus pseudonomiae]KAB8255685.1 P-loop containing nucleoside triphosphate hydrolase protein [Aspergillus pseudonomiae]KAE8399199.1 P-loop containing nucleoside triphosphate hydrolase protein [Aspergillus pseudonomiae]